ncbi:MAG: bifunctional phosphoribosyl-AMP cyclohydrolase/phosphoribosyl-ATP diphosphatase HisIE [Lachnospiraceae bacterium]|jgi:phosphoribosyl-ATP pyrophosphohydrolase/phosphoribosyl-AMP cyclohydrolase|nr:bifunctional phosphoribosyl-AMP cyclohydrolase/phosphoribosyl-ATP diphosphatase HisIE [Lachnospiraceae bacterium]
MKKKLIPSIYVYQGQAVEHYHRKSVISDDIIALAKSYRDRGADTLLLVACGLTDSEKDNFVGLIRSICDDLKIEIYAAGGMNRLEDVKKVLYAGAKRAYIDFTSGDKEALLSEVSARFGKSKIGVVLNNNTTYENSPTTFDNKVCGFIYITGDDDLLSSVESGIPIIALTNEASSEKGAKLLNIVNIEAISGGFVNKPDTDLFAVKEDYLKLGLDMYAFESLIKFEELKTDKKGLIPVIVQQHETNEVLMMAYMNKEAFEKTIKDGRMTYYSRSRDCLWVKGETSGHFQFLKELYYDCDADTLLAKVGQVGCACHTGEHSCFYRPAAVVFEEGNSGACASNPMEILESIYATIINRKENPKEGSYTNYLFDKGLDKILKKIGEEASEIIIAAKNTDNDEVKYEICDFLYHVAVLMAQKGLTWKDIAAELNGRHMIE